MQLLPRARHKPTEYRARHGTAKFCAAKELTMDRNSNELHELMQVSTCSSKPLITDFYAYLPENKFIYRPTGQLWPAASVDGTVKPWPHSDGKNVKPSDGLRLDRAVQQITWHPGCPEVIEGKLAHQGGWIDKPGTRTYNVYVSGIRTMWGDGAITYVASIPTKRTTSNVG
jgi:hypothetical protein